MAAGIVVIWGLNFVVMLSTAARADPLVLSGP